MPIGISSGGNPGEGHISIEPINYQSIGAGTWAITANVPTYWNSAYWGNTGTGAQNDKLSYYVYLAAGTYTMRMLHPKAGDRGIATVKIGPAGGSLASVGTIDQYSSTTSLNRITDITSIVVTTSGLKEIEISVPTKNASSSAYYIIWQELAMWRTA